MEYITKEVAAKTSAKAKEYAESIWPHLNGQPMAWHTFSDGSRCVYVSWCLGYEIKDKDPLNIDEVIRKLLHKWNCDMELIARNVPSYEPIIWRCLPQLSNDLADNSGINVLKSPDKVKLYARFGFRNYDVSSMEGLSIKPQGTPEELLNG